jgi:hypothetical protein
VEFLEAAKLMFMKDKVVELIGPMIPDSVVTRTFSIPHPTSCERLADNGRGQPENGTDAIRGECVLLYATW